MITLAFARAPTFGRMAMMHVREASLSIHKWKMSILTLHNAPYGIRNRPYATVALSMTKALLYLL